MYLSIQFWEHSNTLILPTLLLSFFVGDHPWVSAFYLAGMTHSLPVHALRQSLQPRVQNVTRDMIEGSKR